MLKKSAFRARLDRFEMALLGLMILTLCLQLFVPPIVGLADNGDFSRVALALGITAPEKAGAYHFFGWIEPQYRFEPRRIWFHGLCCYSSQTLLGVLSLPVARLISPRGAFRIQAMGVVNALGLVTATCVLLLALRPLRPALRRLGGLLLLIIFTDVAYVAYFNSFYTEPPTLIFFLAVVGLALLVARRSNPPRWLLACFLLSAAFLATSRPANAGMGLLFALLGIRLVGRTADRSHRRFMAVGAAAISLLSLGYFRQTPRPLRRVFLYNAVFNELLRNSPDPQQDLAVLGLPSDFDRLIGTVAFSPGVPINEERFQKAFFGRVRYATVAKFYAARPGRLWRVVERSGRQAFRMRPPELGNYARTTGKPAGSQSHSFAAWSASKERLVAGHPWLLIANLLTSAIGALALHRRGRAQASRLAGEIWLVVVLVAAVQFALASVGGGVYGLPRLLFLFHAASDLLFVALCLQAAGGVLAWSRLRQAAAMGASHSGG